MARYMLPFALAMICVRSINKRVILRVLKGNVTTFIAHGGEAIMLNPKFIDFIIRISRVYSGVAISEATASSMLYVIGVVDIFVAISLLTFMNRFSIAYMAFWGGLTALARVFFDPTNGPTDMIIRSAHFAVPFFLYLSYYGFKMPKKESKIIL